MVDSTVQHYKPSSNREVRNSKTCKDCRTVKDISEFYECSGMSDGYTSSCKDCKIIKQRLYYRKNKEVVRQKAKDRYWSNPDFYRERISQDNRRREKRLNNDPRHRFSRVLDKKRQIDPDCDLTLDFLMGLFKAQNGRCVLTGRIMTLGEGKDYVAHRDAVSIDRINSAEGYKVGNVRLVTYQANVARGQYSDTELIEFCNSVINSVMTEPNWGKTPEVEIELGRSLTISPAEVQLIDMDTL